jgi:hypothetical protein
MHREAMALLRKSGRGEDLSHDYIAQWVKMQSGTTSQDQAEYALPTDHDTTLFVRYGATMRVAERASMQTEAMSKLSRFWGAQRDRAIWTPAVGKNIRLYVVPGTDGVPQEAKPYEVWYLKIPTVLTAVGTLLDVPDRYTEPIVFYVLQQAVVKLLKDPSRFIELRTAAIASFV